jgi:NAD(P)H dehydrogenase (quinone)
MFVITGATGHSGSVAAEALLDAGKTVRVVVRDSAKAARLAARGAEVFVADLGDPAALARAVRGAEGVFLLSPPDLTARDFIGDRQRLTQKQVDVLAAEHVPHVVLLSSTGAQHASGTGPIVSVHNAERQLRASGLPATFIRAGYFVENWGAVAHPVRSDGVLPSFIAADARVPTVSTVDIGKAVAQALLDGPRGVRVIELSGPSDVSPNDVAAAFSRILGKPVRVVEAPLDAVVPTFTSFGMSENIAQLFREMYEGMARGKVVAEPGEHVRGTTPIEVTLRTLLG